MICFGRRSGPRPPRTAWTICSAWPSGRNLLPIPWTGGSPRLDGRSRRPKTLLAAGGNGSRPARRREQGGGAAWLLPSPRRPACSWPLAFGVGKRCRICPHPRSRQQLPSGRRTTHIRRETLRKRLRQSVPQLAWHTRPRRFLGRRRPPKYACFGRSLPERGPDFLSRAKDCWNASWPGGLPSREAICGH